MMKFIFQIWHQFPYSEILLLSCYNYLVTANFYTASQNGNTNATEFWKTLHFSQKCHLLHLYALKVSVLGSVSG